MLMSFSELVSAYNIENVTGVLHLGAHLAEEAETYASVLGDDISVIWVEANPGVKEQIEAKLERFPTQRLISALIYDQDGLGIPFNVTNYDGMSSSVLQFGTHPEFSPDTVFVETITLPTRTVDSLVEEYNIVASFLSMDLQGAELLALKGAKVFLEHVEWVLTEVNRADVYLDCARVEELDAFLGSYNMERVETYWVPGQDWGDALYQKIR